MKRFAAFVLALAFAACGFAKQVYTGAVPSAFGSLVPGSPFYAVSILNYSDSSLATIYASDGVTPKSNPITTDSLGGYTFSAANGHYIARVTVNGVNYDKDVYLFDQNDGLSVNRTMWPSTSGAGANWASRDGAVFAMSSTGKLGLVGAAQASLTPALYSPIGTSGFCINDGVGTSCWSGYFDAQHESTANWSVGAEFAIKNKGANIVPTAYNQTGGTFGLWMAGGGDASYGGSPTNPNAAAMMVLQNAATWNKGIVFRATSLTGTSGTGTGEGIALEMAADHAIIWDCPDGTVCAKIRSDNVTASSQILQLFAANAIRYYGPNSKAVFDIQYATNGVNNIKVQSATTGTYPTVAAEGDDTNAGIGIDSKGSGSVFLRPGGTPVFTVTSTSATSSGSVLSSGATSGIGYTTGAGGTVTQTTDKTTGVTVNKASMQITTAASALASGAKSTFTVTDSAVAATDVPVCAVASGGTASAYRAAVTAIASGSFSITIENITAGSLSESPVINCNIIKGASS